MKIGSGDRAFPDPRFIEHAISALCGEFVTTDNGKTKDYERLLLLRPGEFWLLRLSDLAETR
jgi:hypothetical protein